MVRSCRVARRSAGGFRTSRFHQSRSLRAPRGKVPHSAQKACTRVLPRPRGGCSCGPHDGAPAPERCAAPCHRKRRGLSGRTPTPGDGRARDVRGGDRGCRHGSPRPARHLEVEPDRYLGTVSSVISTNWRGRPRASHQTIVDLVCATLAAGDLGIRADADQRYYEEGITVGDAALATGSRRRHALHREWDDTGARSDSRRAPRSSARLLGPSHFATFRTPTCQRNAPIGPLRARRQARIVSAMRASTAPAVGAIATSPR